MFSRVDTVIVNVNRLEEARKWYENILELQLSYDGGNYLVYQVGNGETPITIQEGLPIKSSTMAILFSDALEETHLKLKGQGVKVSEIFVEGSTRFFSLEDPFGNSFEVCHWS